MGHIGGVYLILNEKLTFFSIFLNFFGTDGLKHFIVQDDTEIVEKILFGTEKMTRTDNKITLCNIRFNLNACKNYLLKS